MSTPKPRYMKIKRSKSTNTRSKKIDNESELATSLKENSNKEFTKSDEILIEEKDSCQNDSSLTETESETDESVSDDASIQATTRRRKSVGSMEKKKLKTSNVIEDTEPKSNHSLQDNKKGTSKGLEEDGQEKADSVTLEVCQETDASDTMASYQERVAVTSKEKITQEKTSSNDSESIQPKKRTSKSPTTRKKSEKPAKTTSKLKTSTSTSKKDKQSKTVKSKKIKLEKSEESKDDKAMILEKLQELNRPTHIPEFTSIIKNSIKKPQLISIIEKMGEEGLINTKLISKKILMFSCKDEIVDEDTNKAFLDEIEKIKEVIATEKAYLHQLKTELQNIGNVMSTNEIQEKIDSVSVKIDAINKTIEERNKEKVVDKLVYEKETERMQAFEKQLKTRTKLYKNIKSVLEEGFGKSWKEIALEIGIEEE